LCTVSVCPAVVLTQPGAKVEFWMSTVVVLIGASQVAGFDEQPATAIGSATRATASKRRRIAKKGIDPRPG
jgi:hypothetical protein